MRISHISNAVKYPPPLALGAFPARPCHLRVGSLSWESAGLNGPVHHRKLEVGVGLLLPKLGDQAHSTELGLSNKSDAIP